MEKNSIVFTDCSINNVIIDSNEGKTITLKTDGNTLVRKTIVKTDTYLEEMTDGDGGFESVELNGGKDVKLSLSGSFSEVKVKGEKNTLSLDKGSISSLVITEDSTDAEVYLEEDAYAKNVYVDTAVKITGEGEVGSIVINASDAEVEGLPDNIEIRPGLTAKINGQEMNSNDAEIISSYPKILSSYPDFKNMDATKLTAIYKTNKAGTLYWAVTQEDDDLPTTEELIEGYKDGVKYGKLNVEAKTEKPINITGLKSNVDYVISAVLVDEKDDKSSRKKEEFTTNDNIVPSFVSGYPKISSLGSTYANIAIIPTKDTSFYWALYPVNSIAPTAANLVNQKTDGDIDSGISKSGKINIESTIDLSGLKEATSYDFYLVSSDGDKLTSAVKKINFTTTDSTPPNFVTGYPKADKITDTSIAVKYNIDKDGTVYYVIVKHGTVFPTPVFPETKVPDLQSDETKSAIITGNNATKKGSVSGKASVEGNINITGLEKQTPYDIYFVAQDKYKNISNVKVLQNVKTNDVYPPTATQSFDEVTDGSPMVETNIFITFSEIVCSSYNGDDSTSYGKELTDVEKTQLKYNLTLYDLSSSKRTAVAMDYDKIKVEAVDGKTVVTLPKDATNLSSGNMYEIELNKIMDTSANRMSEKTLLPSFKTVAPLVELVKTVAPKDYDITFRLDPQAVNTADNILYDTVLESDKNVRFTLYSRETEDEEFKPCVSPEGTLSYMASDTPLTIRYLIDMQGKNVEDNPDYNFEQFNKFTNSREYAIKFSEVEGNKVRASWGTTVNVSVQSVIASSTNLRAIAANVKGNLDNLVSNGSATLVNYPSKFITSASFTDTIVPQMLEGYPKFESGETKIRSLTRATKPAKMYYLIAPKNIVGQPVPDSEIPTHDPGQAVEIESAEEDLPSALDIINGSLKPEGGYNGVFEITSKDVESGFYLEKLDPNTEYDFFFVLKGTPPEPSKVRRFRIETTDVEKPKFIPGLTNVYNKGEDYVDITTQVDSESTIYWIVYPHGVYTMPSGGDAGNVPSPDDIKNIVENSDVIKPIASGMTKTKGNEQVIIKCSNLDTNVYYDFFATAQKDLGGDPADVESVWNIKPRDLTAPMIASATTTISKINAATPDGETASYNGTLGLVFTEPLYYIVTDGSPIKALTQDRFESGYAALPPKNNAGEGVSVISTTGEADTEDGSTLTAISSINFKFEKARAGSSISFNYSIYDKEGNYAGKLNVVFQEDKIDTTLSKWVATFVNEKDPKSTLMYVGTSATSKALQSTSETFNTVSLEENKTVDNALNSDMLKTSLSLKSTLKTSDAPIFTSLPQVMEIGEDYFTAKATVDKNSNIYWAVYPASDDAPNVFDIKAGVDAASSGYVNASANQEFTIDSSGLTGGKKYSLYVFAEDESTNTASAVKSVTSIETEKGNGIGITAYTSISKTIEKGKNNVYTGTIKLNFAKDIYYKTSSGNVKLITPAIFAQRLSSLGVKSIKITSSSSRTSGGVKQVVISFTEASDKNIISHGYSFCDASGNVMGALKLIFNEKSEDWEMN